MFLGLNNIYIHIDTHTFICLFIYFILYHPDMYFYKKYFVTIYTAIQNLGSTHFSFFLKNKLILKFSKYVTLEKVIVD